MDLAAAAPLPLTPLILDVEGIPLVAGALVVVAVAGARWAVDDSASSPTRRRFVSVVAAGGESLSRVGCERDGPKPGA